MSDLRLFAVQFGFAPGCIQTQIAVIQGPARQVAPASPKPAHLEVLRRVLVNESLLSAYMMKGPDV